MFKTRKRTRPRRRRGSIIVPTAIFGSVVGLGITALAVDTGLMYSAKQELQSAADATALAAASQLGATSNAQALALQEGASFANLNQIMGDNADLVTSDLVFGHAVLSNGKYDFNANQQPYDAIRVTLRRDQTVSDGPVSLLFAKTFGLDGASMEASATAMLVPRDIGLVIDLSGSMNDDSELRHHLDFASGSSGTRPAVQINLKDIWTSLPVTKGRGGILNGANPPAPGAPAPGDNQPATGAGTPQSAAGNPDPGNEPSGGSPNPAGPRWGWMTGYGQSVDLGSYSAVTDGGLYYIPRYTTTTDPDVIANLTEAGYSSAERSALLSSKYDGTTSYYRNRVKVLLGLAGWTSGKSQRKYYSGGNGNNIIGSGELTQQASFPFNSTTWDNFIDYVASSSSQMKNTDPNLRYRFGIKTVTNYLLEKRARHSYTPELADAPEKPLFSVKDAVQTMIDEIVNLQTQDHVSLETFAQYGTHRVDLTIPASGQTLPEVLQTIPTTMYGFQAGHDTSITNIGGGLDQAITELNSVRARTAAVKVVILLTDGKPNVDSGNNYVGNNAPGAISWALDRADTAKDQGMTVYVVGVGADVNPSLLQDIASAPENYFFADSAPDPNNNGQPLYVQQLQQIFQTLGGKRPVRLIQ